MKISMITVCYNSAKTIRRTFESVLTQNFDDYEYLIVDGASKDGTLEIIKEYEPRFQGKMRWVSEPDNGIYDAMNKGIRMAQGDIIGIINSDDYCEPGAFQIITDLWESHPDADMVYGCVRHTLENNQGIEVLRRAPGAFLLNPMEHPGCYVARSAYQKYGMFDLQYRIAADYDLTIRFYLAGAKFVETDAILSNFMESGTSYQFKRQGELECVRVLRSHNQITRQGYYLHLLRSYLKSIFRLLIGK